MTDTPHLGLPTIEAAQAQKHVTHNEALRVLDTLVMLAVLDRDLSAPPSSPAEGDRYIVKTTGTGAFAGNSNKIAHFADGGWSFYSPQAGWVCYLIDDGTLVAWNGTAWGDFFSTVTSIQNLALLGVGTTADSSNPVSAKLNNALWAAKTVAEGGDGTLRYKLSKESAAKTLSFLFQDNYSGRAEIGLTGDDDFHFKVSPDGSAWVDALIIDKTTGSAKVNSGFFLTGDISPSQITSDQNDYNPTGLATASVLRLSTDASRNVTGFAGGGDGRIVAIVNAGANNIVLKDASASSSAANRYSFGADITLATMQSAVLWYDATDSRWKLLAGPGGAVSSVFGRTGVVVAASGDYSITQIANAREVLTANRTYYVRTDGSDSNNGLSNTAGGAFLTLQKAVNTVAALDLSIYNVTIQIADGTYTGAVVVNGPWIGSGTVTLLGNSGTPANVLLSTGASNAITVQNGGALAVKDLKLTNTGTFLLVAQTGGFISFANLDFGACGAQQIRTSDNGRITASGNYTISGGGAYHVTCVGCSAVRIQNRTVTLTGTPAFATAFANAQLCSATLFNGCTFSGSATGPRYEAIQNGVLYTNGGGANYFPGDSVGSTATGGQYM
jgi:hypothetical protein